MVVVPAKPYANAPEVNRKSPLGTSTMPGPPMPAPAPRVKSPSNWSVQPAATVKLAWSVPVAVPSQARSSVPESTSIPPGLVRKGKLPPPVMVAVLMPAPTTSAPWLSIVAVPSISLCQLTPARTSSVSAAVFTKVLP